MFEALSFYSETPLLIVDGESRLCFCNKPLEQAFPDIGQRRIGTSIYELDLPFIAPYVTDAAAQLMGQSEHEGLIVPLQSSDDSVLVFSFTTIGERGYLGFALLAATADITEVTPVTSIFELMNAAFSTRPEDSPVLSDQDQHLIQSEKMAAIGQLSAGVAHEINNPIGYICSNLNSLSGYVGKLIQIADTVETAQNVEDIRRFRDQLDYHYIKTDILDCIDESIEGANRVRDIIAALKDFSHSDDGTLSPYQLKDAFESTLKLVSNEIKYTCTVHKEYAPIPEIECSPNQLKQVVMNLIVNAAHAIPQQGNLWLRLGQRQDWVWLEVEDDGDGIPDDKRDRIFEPFFTTKAVGKGTGLGLSLSYSIIERHRGKILVYSQEGEGSRFRIWLPVKQQGSGPIPVP